MTGLHNLGNTCYFNAALQVLAHCRPLVKHLVACPDTQDSRAVSSLLRSLFIKMWSEDDRGCRHVLSPSGLLRAVMRKSTTFELRRQGDAHEMASVLLDLLTEDNAIPSVRNVIEGVCLSVVECTACGSRSSGSKEPFTSLSVALPQQRCSPLLTSNDLVRAFFAPTPAEGWRCEACNRTGTGRVTTGLWSVPRILLVCTKRFGADGTSVNRMPVAPSKRIDFTLEANRPAVAPGSPAEATLLGTSGGKRRGFRLVGAVCHIGSTQSDGHYVACCRRPGAGWRMYDDDVMTRMPGGARDVSSQAAYVLAYEIVRWDAATPPHP
jgi:ubiquitin C-terminal hydrolase